jgi:hypothetical protein
MTPRLTVRSMWFDQIDPNATLPHGDSLGIAAYRRRL